MTKHPSDSNTPPDTVDAWLAHTAQRFRVAGIDSGRLDARLLLSHVTGMSMAKIIALGTQNLDNETRTELEHLVLRRVAREPVSRILGVREFYGRRFSISSATLDPRPDSETIIEAALDLVRAEGWSDKEVSILDVGTGSGCLLLTLLAELPRATGLGTDISCAALNVAKDNAAMLGLSHRAQFRETDLLTGITNTFHLVVSNPPYIPSKDICTLNPEVFEYDPRLALDGGADGLSAYRTLAHGISSVISDGWVLFEVGYTQARVVADMLLRANSGFDPENCHILRDLGGHERVVAIRSRGCGN